MVNPDAGDHTVTADPVEVAAARRAASRSWVEGPYEAHRFGARGRRFSHSDSGWLVTLCDLPLAAAAPARGPRSAVLGQCADDLRDRRRAALAEARLVALDLAFADRVGAPWNERHRRMGGLLAAAVADERQGLAGAVSSIEPWATDPAHFPPLWIEAVAATIDLARASPTGALAGAASR
jgi:hypothetical protein